jgi:molecular chaperone HscB
MAWREALEEAGSPAEVEALDLEVGRQEKALQGQLALHLDESLDLEAAVGAVRSLMFLGRFRADIHRRMEALEC